MNPDKILLSFQLRFLSDDARIKVMEKSRQAGMSWTVACGAVLKATEPEHPRKVWYVGYNKDMPREFIEDCAFFARLFNIVAGEAEEKILQDEDKDILTFTVKFENGMTITALSSAPSNLRSKRGVAILDEAAFHPDLKALIKAAIALTLWGGEVWILSTHDGDANEFNRLIEDIRKGRLNYSLHRVTFKEAVEQGLYKRICQREGWTWSQEAEDEWVKETWASYGDDAEEELGVIPSQGNGTPFPRALVERCMSRDIPVLRYEQDKEFLYKDADLKTSEVESWLEDNIKPLLDKMDTQRRTYMGEDFARSGHLTVFEPLQEQQNATFTAPFVLEIRNLPFEEQGQVAVYILDRLPMFTHATFDARGNGQWLAEKCFVKYGEKRITMSMPSEKWYRENMPAYQAAFEDQSILIPYDADIIEDHRDFKKIDGVTKLPKLVEKKAGKRKKKERHGDTGIAGCNAWHATRQPGGEELEITVAGDNRVTSNLDNFLRRR